MSRNELHALLREAVLEAEDPVAVVNELRQVLHEVSPLSHHPVDLVQWIPLHMVQANDYNPNIVADKEMASLHVSIDHDGYTQPVVSSNDGSGGYVIVDGFHRRTICERFQDVRDSTMGYVPVVVLDKPLADRMAATVRHNRARGNHTVTGMSALVLEMLEEGKSDAEVCHALGLDAEELIRLKHITGFSKLFEDAEYSKAWRTKFQIMHSQEYERTHGKSYTGL